MSAFTDIFGGNTIYPSDPTYFALALTASTELQWPLEQNMGSLDSLAAIIDVTPSGAGLSITLPDATQGSNGYVTTFYNAGADTFTVRDQGGNTVLTVASGTAWNVYLRSNATVNGLWRTFQMGAGTSTANAAALAGAGLEADGTTLNEEVEVDPQSNDYTIVDGDRAKVIVSTGGVVEFTLPDPAAVGANWFCWVKNLGGGSLTITPSSGTIDDAGTLVLSTVDSTMLVSDGVDFFTCGFGQDQNSIFDFISLPVPGTGDYTLSGSELNRVAYEFTGILTGNRRIIVPAAVQQYWVYNNTSGAFTLEVTTLLGSGVVVEQGSRRILYCDGTDVVPAETILVNIPTIVQGDTLYGSAPGVLSALPKDTNAQRVWTNGGVDNNPLWDQVSLLLGVRGYRAANKSTQTSRNSTIVSAADPALALATLAIGTWDVEVFIQLGGVAGGGFRFQLISTGAMTGTVTAHGNVNGAVSPVSTGLNIDTTFAALSGANDQWLLVKARVSVTVAGNLSFGWAQNSSDVTNTSVFLGFMTAKQVA